MRPAKKNRYDLKILWTGNTQYISTERKGIAAPNAPDGVGITRDNQFLQYFNINRYRRIFSSQLVGLHQPSDKLKLDWVLGYMGSNYMDWDRKVITGLRFNDPFGVSTQSEFNYLIPNASPDAVRYSRWFFDLPEQSFTAALNAEYNLNPKKPNSFVIKSGLFAENKSREFLVRQLGLTRSGSEILMKEFFADFNSYEGLTDVLAGYIGIDIPFNLRWKLYTGVRYEYYRQTIISAGLKNFGGAEKIIREANDLANSLFSSFNLTYKLNADNLFRLAYAKTSNRPEFREIAPFEYLDLENFLTAYGNPSLKVQSLIDNFDLRFENYGKNTNFSIGAFYKYFTDPIEIAFGLRSAGDNTTPINAYKAQTYGLEFEFRRSLLNKNFNGGGFRKILSNTDVIINASLIQSIVETAKNVPDSLIRPMMGQSPYVLNLILSYTNPDNKISFNLAYNRMGPRIIFIGDNIQNFSIYELPRDILDITLGKEFNKWLQLDVSVQNLLNAKFVHVQDVNRNGKLEPFEGYNYQIGGDNVFRAFYENPQVQITARIKIN
jgi:outer membrane receptor protein involved in Fe transport